MRLGINIERIKSRNPQQNVEEYVLKKRKSVYRFNIMRTIVDIPDTQVEILNKISKEQKLSDEL